MLVAARAVHDPGRERVAARARACWRASTASSSGRTRATATSTPSSARFTAEKRKKAKRERRRVAEAGIRFAWRGGHELTRAEWRAVHALKSATFHRHGHEPYLGVDCFLELSRTAACEPLVLLATAGAALVAVAIFFRGAETLYGRYWGAAGELPQPAFRGLLPPGHRVLHPRGAAALRARHAGRAQDRARLRADPDPLGAPHRRPALSRRDRPLPRRGARRRRRLRGRDRAPRPVPCRRPAPRAAGGAA